LLTREEGKELLLSFNLQYKPSFIDKIVFWCGPSPYLLKKIGTYLSGHELDEDVSDLTLEKLFLEEFSNYYKDILSVLSKEAYFLLKDISKGKSIEPKDRHFLHPLLKQGFLMEEEEGEIECFSPSFLSFIKQKLSKKYFKSTYMD
jgi:hypothetical protein